MKEKCGVWSDVVRGSRVIAVKYGRVKGHKGQHTHHEMSLDGGGVTIWSWK